MPSDRVVVTGATGLLGSLTAAALIDRTDVGLLLPIRAAHRAEDAIAHVREELRAMGSTRLAELETRAQVVLVEGQDEVCALADHLVGTWDLIHCAGCLDYFDRTRLDEGNVQLTARLLELARARGVRRFVHISTAYACGYQDGTVREAPHDEPANDPTEYTRSKREAERRVREAGVPYVIVRPSIVIGDRHTGRYVGKRYGLYQLWAAAERFLTTWVADYHIVAPREARPNFVHQDVFQDGVLAAWRHLDNGAIFHVVSREETLPSLRDLWRLWVAELPRPERFHFYTRVEDVDVTRLDRRQRAWIEFTATNLDIASHRFRFETHTRDRLARDEGFVFADATLESVGHCQRWFIERSPRLLAYRDAHRDRLHREPEVIDHDGAADGP